MSFIVSLTLIRREVNIKNPMGKLRESSKNTTFVLRHVKNLSQSLEHWNKELTTSNI